MGQIDSAIVRDVLGIMLALEQTSKIIVVVVTHAVTGDCKRVLKTQQNGCAVDAYQR
jgi:ABC-type lipoprotein export system ATPase subunit